MGLLTSRLQVGVSSQYGRYHNLGWTECFYIYISVFCISVLFVFGPRAARRRMVSEIIKADVEGYSFCLGTKLGTTYYDNTAFTAFNIVILPSTNY